MRPTFGLGARHSGHAGAPEITFDEDSSLTMPGFFDHRMMHCDSSLTMPGYFDALCTVTSFPGKRCAVVCRHQPELHHPGGPIIRQPPTTAPSLPCGPRRRAATLAAAPCSALRTRPSSRRCRRWTCQWVHPACATFACATSGPTSGTSRAARLEVVDDAQQPPRPSPWSAGDAADAAASSDGNADAACSSGEPTSSSLSSSLHPAPLLMSQAQALHAHLQQWRSNSSDPAICAHKAR